MADDTVPTGIPEFDRNGRPSQIAAAFASFGGTFSDGLLGDARKRDAYWLAHDIAKKLTDITSRLEHASYALELARKKIPNSTDDFELMALVEMAIPYSAETELRMREAFAHVLAALEKGVSIQA
ncbi:MAG: hypothetical protein AB9M53_08360 [Leptothrix sp. (in: b-proteobacteria)]